MSREIIDYQITKFSYSGGKTVSVPITVTIKDENDNDPQFSRSSYQIYVTENSNSLASANIIRVTDIDEGANGQLELTSNYFEITPENGAADEYRVELTSAISLTPDATCNGIEVIVDDEFIATDFGSPDPRTNTANVRVIITDANDHAPIYTFNQNPSRLRVKEQSPKGTVIADLDYQDDDPCQPNNEVNMAIENSIYSRFFAIENRKLIVADDSLGFDSDELVGTKIPLNLTISDRGNPSLSSLQLVEIEIDDRNDELPQFESFSTQESVLENRPIGYSIGTFGRTDVDLNSNISASLSCNCFKNDQTIFRAGFI